MIIVLMGVTGSGKTTIGKQLAAELGWAFLEGDDFHPVENLEKLRRGIPLTDEDRTPWLSAIRGAIVGKLAAGESTVVACSALKHAYRDMLRVSDAVRFVYLDAGAPLVSARLRTRTGHFMNPALIESQYETLEEPAHALHMPADQPPMEIVMQIKDALGL